MGDGLGNNNGVFTIINQLARRIIISLVPLCSLPDNHRIVEDLHKQGVSMYKRELHMAQ